MIRPVVSLAVTAVMISAMSPPAESTGCPVDKRAFVSATHLKTWDDLYSSYKNFRRCDDGAIGEGYSDFVARTLARSWETLPSLQSLASKDSEFRTFVIRHIDATADFTDLARASANAEHRCP